MLEILIITIVVCISFITVILISHIIYKCCKKIVNYQEILKLNKERLEFRNNCYKTFT